MVFPVEFVKVSMNPRFPGASLFLRRGQLNTLDWKRIPV